MKRKRGMKELLGQNGTWGEKLGQETTFFTGQSSSSHSHG